MSSFLPTPDCSGVRHNTVDEFNGISESVRASAMQAVTIKARNTFVVPFLLGLTTAMSVVFATFLVFILFCPIWDEWTSPETPVIKLEPNIYMGLVPIPSPIVNKGTEIPRTPAPIIQPQPEVAPLPPAPAPPQPMPAP